MSPDVQALLLTAITIACLHTISGPDHYLPFIALSKTGRWSIGKTIGWTLACGMGHVISSVLLGLGGAALGWSFTAISGLENIRGSLAGWLMLVLGLLYTAWALYRLYKKKQHKHFDMEKDGSLYVYEHQHNAAAVPQQRFRVTPWALFIIFILGPCEPMIPLLFYPAAQSDWPTMVLLIAVYTVCTLAIMLLMVLLGFYGLAFTRTQQLERYVHVIGGVTIVICGAGMLWMGW